MSSSKDRACSSCARFSREAPKWWRRSLSAFRSRTSAARFIRTIFVRCVCVHTVSKLRDHSARSIDAWSRDHSTSENAAPTDRTDSFSNVTDFLGEFELQVHTIVTHTDQRNQIEIRNSAKDLKTSSLSLISISLSVDSCGPVRLNPFEPVWTPLHPLYEPVLLVNPPKWTPATQISTQPTAYLPDRASPTRGSSTSQIMRPTSSGRPERRPSTDQPKKNSSSVRWTTLRRFAPKRSSTESVRSYHLR